MKFIKIYEKYNRDDYYQKISSTQYNDEIDLIGEIDFISTEYREIIKFFKERNILPIFSLVGSPKIEMGYTTIYLHRMPDEYYLAGCMGFNLVEYYKCDQFSGLLEFFDFIIKNNKDFMKSNARYESINYVLGKDEGYEKISSSDFNQSLRDTSKWILSSFTDYEKEKIFIFYQFELSDHHSAGIEYFSENLHGSVVSRHNGDEHNIKNKDVFVLINDTWRIYKCQDEWFYAMKEGKDRYRGQIESYFKCDQINGLINCLSNNK